MDNAVSLVQAYLRVNGYFTVAEYPVLEVSGRGHRMITDIDILAFRFSHAGHQPESAKRAELSELTSAPDPFLQSALGNADMLIGEVKEGPALLNGAARNPEVLAAALVRFGCCAPNEAAAVVQRLRNEGAADTAAGHRIRLVAFGGLPAGDVGPAAVVPMAHVVTFLSEFLRAHWNVLRHAQIKDPALGFLVTLEKATR